MGLGDLINIAMDLIEWVIDWVWFYCLLTLVLIFGWTVYSAAKRSTDMSAPGIKRLFGSSRRRS